MDSDIDVAVIPSTTLPITTGMEKVADEVKARYGNRLGVLVSDPIGEALDAFKGKRTRSQLWSRIYRDGVRVPLPRRRGQQRA